LKHETTLELAKHSNVKIQNIGSKEIFNSKHCVIDKTLQPIKLRKINGFETIKNLRQWEDIIRLAPTLKQVKS